MAGHISPVTWLWLVIVLLLLQVSPAIAFGAGNIASISKIEGHNWRHGDIEDMLKTIACIKGHKWTSMMVRRVYFGNWLRDYSQALDVGTLKGIQSGTIRILIWVLSFLSFGYATAEFEVTEERLGVYRPEEHIDNPKDYADNIDARKFDPRLRPPVQPIELQIDSHTGMKNYIANDNLGIATSSGYVKHSLSRSIHFGRVYTSGASGTIGKEADLCEALRCLGQALHCLEDFGAHTNYTELALREMGHRNVFPHTGIATGIDLPGGQRFPLVTGTFGVVDFLHSVLGEATDHFAQTEIEQMDIALGDAQSQSKPPGANRELSVLTELLPQVGFGGYIQQAEQLQAQSDAQARLVASRGLGEDPFAYDNSRSYPKFNAPPGSLGGPPGPGIPGMSANFDPTKTAAQIYPILEFRDRVVRSISKAIEKVPGLQSLVEKISETLTVFVLSLLAPFIRPIINAVSAQLKNGSSSVVDASGKHQYEPWTDPNCSDPTHSLLSKDHFSNILNEPAGQVAACILQYVAPRVLYAWEHPEIPVDQVLHDVIRVFHHPGLRDMHCDIHRDMYEVVQRWEQAQRSRGIHVDQILNSESVRAGKNHIGGDKNHSHGSGGISNFMGSGTHSKVSGAPWEKLSKLRNATGVGRDDIGSNVGENPTAYGYNALRPAGLQPEYRGPSPEPIYTPLSPYQRGSYDGQSSYPPKEAGYVPPQAIPSWNPLYSAPNAYAPQQSDQGSQYPDSYPPGAYPPPQQQPQQQGYGYGAPQPYPYDPSAPPPRQQQPPGSGYY